MTKPPENKIFHTAIRQEVDRILQSPIFAQSERLSRFLRYTVEHVVTGKAESLKEYVIGTEVYDRKPPYHPSQDSIVRTEARRLRSKLKEYYELEGKEDQVFIFFRPGSYVPVFRMKDSDSSYRVGAEAPQEDLFVAGSGIQVAVIPFLDLTGSPLSARYASGITEELLHELIESEGCRVVSFNSEARLEDPAPDGTGLALKLGVQIFFEGTVRDEEDWVRVTGRIVSSEGVQLWSQRLDADVHSAKAFEMQEQFASALVNRVKPQITIVMAGKASVSQRLLSAYPTLLKAESLAEECLTPELQVALTKFHEVAQATPNYARPFCGIARCYAWMALHGGRDSREYTSQSRTAAEIALKLDPKMADALTAMGTVEALEWQWEQAEISLRTAAEQGFHATAKRQLAMLLTLHGRFDEACGYLESAQRIDPFSYLQKVARARFFYLSKRFEEAVKHFSTPHRHGQIPLDAQLDLALAYAAAGKHEAALQLAHQIQRCTGADLPTLAAIAEILAKAQDLNAAESLCEKSSLLSETVNLSKYRQARLAASLGRHDKAMILLSMSYAAREPELPYLSVEPCFDSMRQMHSFAELVREVKTTVPATDHAFLTVS